MATTRIRLAVVVTGLVCCLGCGTFGGNTVVSELYYFYGPEDTLEVLEEDLDAALFFAEH